jgi:hypothetical protein
MLVDIQSQVKILVQQVVEAYLKDKVLENEKKPIAILLGYQSPNPTYVLEAITPLLNIYEVKLIVSKEWANSSSTFSNRPFVLLEEINQQELTAIIEESSVLVIPAASYQLLSKLALTMDDELAVWVAIQYQLLGKPVVIANNGVEPNVYQQIHAPHTVQERIQSYIRQIQTDQVKWVPLNKLTQTVEHQFTAYEEKQSLILAKHVEKAFHTGLKELVVPLKSKITPSAKDLAKELKIVITKSDA